MHVRRLAWTWLVVGRRLAWVWLVVGRLLVRLWGWVWILVLGWRLRTRDCVALLLRVARLTVAALHRLTLTWSELSCRSVLCVARAV